MYLKPNLPTKTSPGYEPGAAWIVLCLLFTLELGVEADVYVFYLLLCMAKIELVPVETINLVEHDVFHINHVSANVAVAPDGRFAVFDSAANQAVLFSKNGQLIKRFGRKGQGPGEFDFFGQIQWIGDEEVWAVVDWGNTRVSKWSTKGELVSEAKTPRPSVGGAVHFPNPNTMVYSDFTFGVFGGNPRIITFDLVEQTSETIFEHELSHKIPVIRLKSGGVQLCAWNPALVYDTSSRFFAVAFGTDSAIHLLDYSGTSVHKTIYPEFKRYPITEEDVAQQKTNLQGSGGAAFEAAFETPETWPLITHLTIDHHGRIWIFGAKRFGQTYPVMIYSAGGKKLAEGILEHLPAAIHKDVLYYIAWDEDEDPSFVKAKIFGL